MLTIAKTVLPSPEQWEIIIEGMRNPMNSWELSDSFTCTADDGADVCFTQKCQLIENCPVYGDDDFFVVGPKDHDLMMRLAKGGPVHAKYRRMIPVFLTINAPLYWWKEFDTYKVGTVANSCSTMHKIHAKEFTTEDFSFEKIGYLSIPTVNKVIEDLNLWRTAYTKYEEMSIDFKSRYTVKECWENMIQILPTSYNQKRTVMLNYEVLVNIYHSRKNHKLDEWHTFCDWIEGLPLSEIITGEG